MLFHEVRPNNTQEKNIRMSETHVRVVARFIAKPDRVEEVKAVLAGFVEPTRAEKGCVLYEFLQNTAEPADMTFVEEWESDEDLSAHSKSRHLAEGRERLNGLLELPADVRKYYLIK